MAKRRSRPNFEMPYDYFDLLYLSKPRNRQKIREMLIGRAPYSPAPYAIIDYLRSSRVGGKGPICKCILVENRYYDRDHVRAFSAFYSHSFRDVPKECTRLHFFSKELNDNDILKLESHIDSYLGFCVLRPLPARKIGRTVLSRVESRPELEFPTCHGKFEVNVGGSSLIVKGPAFMEQDTMVSACASVAIWMSTTTLAARYGLPDCSTAEITQKANEFMCQNRAMPSEGLTHEQMTYALREIGYEPLFIEATTAEETKNAIYTYIESEIPPILLCRLATGGDHAIVGVGHRYRLPLVKPKKTSVSLPNEPPMFFCRSSEWIPSILVNDDQRGPFRELTFIDPDQRKLKRRIRKAHPTVDISKLSLEEWNCPVAIDMNMPKAGFSGGEQIANIAGVIVPLPKNVLLTGQQAEKKVALLITYLHWLIHKPPPEDLVLRTYLIPSNEYKRRIEESKMNDFVKLLYRGKPMSRWIWVTEISSIDSYNSPAPSKWLIRGEVIIDSTSSHLAPDFIALHYVMPDWGRVATMKPEHLEPEEAIENLLHIPQDKEYPGWIR